MDNKNESQEFDLDDILNEFHDLPGEKAEEADPALESEIDPELDAKLEELLHLPELDISPVTVREPERKGPDPEDTEALAAEGQAESGEAPVLMGDTVRFTPITGEKSDEAAGEAADNTVPDDPTIQIPPLEREPKPASAEPAFEVEEQFIPSPIVFTPRSRLKELR